MNNPVVTKTNTPDWDFLLTTLKEDKCILLLGPDVIKIADTGQAGKVHTVQDALLTYLDAYNDPNIIKYYSQDEFFLFKDLPAQTKIYYKLKRFYANAVIKRNIYENITKIPFPLIVSVSPDMYLKEAFGAMGFRHRFEVYNKTQAPRAIAAPTGKDPVVYNLFGCADDEESLVLTHDGLFDFLSALMGDKKLPNEVVTMFQRATNIIFLGFKFEKWYVQLLLRLLRIHNPLFNRSSKYSAKLGSTGSSEIEDFCRAQFSIDFIDTNVEEFIETLCDKCGQADMLRQAELVQPVLTGIPKVRQLIMQDKVAEALTTLTAVVSDDYDLDNLSNTLILLNLRYTRLENRRISGMLSSSDAEAERNNVINNILGFIGTLED